jgi:hypothetical protein
MLVGRSAELQALNYSRTEFSDVVRKDLRVPDKIRENMRVAALTRLPPELITYIGSRGGRRKVPLGAEVEAGGFLVESESVEAVEGVGVADHRILGAAMLRGYLVSEPAAKYPASSDCRQDSPVAQPGAASRSCELLHRRGARLYRLPHLAVSSRRLTAGRVDVGG